MSKRNIYMHAIKEKVCISHSQVNIVEKLVNLSIDSDGERV